MTVPAAGGDKKNIVKMAYIYFQEGRWDKAIEEYKKLIAIDPEDVNTHNMLGDVYVKKGAVREAFEEYIKVSSDFSNRGQADKATIVNKKIAALDSTKLTPEGQQQQSLIRETIRAESAMESGDVDGAIEALSEVTKLDKDNLAAYSKLAELYEKKGRAQDAVDAYMHVGDSFLKSRVLKKAQEIYQRVVQLQPNHLDARSNLAQIFLKQGSEGDAKKEFLVLAELALNTGDLERAQQNATKAIELKSIEAHYIQGVILFKKQQYSEAKTELDNLLRFKVNHVGALVHLARVHLEQNQPDKANEIVQRALKVEKDNPLVLEVQADLAMKRGAKAEAAQAYKSLLERAEAKNDFAKASEYARYLVSLDENSSTAIGKLGEMLKSAGEKKEASDTFFKNVLLLEKQGKSDEAAQWARKTLELNPDHAEAQKRIVGMVVASALPPESKPVQPSAETKPAAVPAPIPAPVPPAPAPAKVMDLEGLPEVTAPFAGPRPVPAPAAAPPAEPVKTNVVELEQEAVDEWKAELSIADNFIRQGMLEEAIEICQRLAETYPDKPEIKERLNQAYQAYVKTGEDVIGALEAERKAKEDEEKNLRAEMEKKAKEEADRMRAQLEQKARQEAEIRANIELERKVKEDAERKALEEKERQTREEAERSAREETEQKAREDAERKFKEEAERKFREEIEKKVREETDQKIRQEAEKKAREEAEQKVREEAERKTKEETAKTLTKKESVTELKSLKLEPTSKGDSVLEEGKDDFMTIAVADIYTRQGLHEEAAKIYRRILQNEPDNLEARKKLLDVEKLLGPSSAPTPAPAKPAELPPPVAAPKTETEHPSGEKDSGGKKKSNRVGYV